MSTPAGFDANESALNTAGSSSFDPLQYAQTLKTIYQDPTFTTRPGLAKLLADGDASDEDIKTIGGFTHMLDLEKQVQMARTGRIKIDLTPYDKALLSSTGFQYKDVDMETALKIEAQARSKQYTQDKGSDTSLWQIDGSDNWLETAIGAIGEAATSAADAVWEHVLVPIGEGASWLYDKTIGAAYRALASTPGALGTTPTLQQYKDQAETLADARANGYDTSNTWDMIQFYANGEAMYRDLSSQREQYGDEAVEAAKKYWTDPDKFYESLTSMDPDQAAHLMDLLNQPGLLQAVDARHYSPGRDLARGLFKEGSIPFTLASGALDAAASWYVDPFLVVGKGINALRAAAPVAGGSTLLNRFRRGVDNMLDQDAIRNVMENNPSVRAGWNNFLIDAKTLRETEDPTEKAALYAGMRTRYRPIMGLLPEVNGARVLTPISPAKGETTVAGLTDAEVRLDAAGVPQALAPAVTGTPIEDIDDLTNYLVDTAGLLRLNQGFAAQKAVLMPGKISIRAELQARRAEARTRNGLNNAPWVDYEGDVSKYLPNPDEALDPDTIPQSALRGAALYDNLRSSLPFLGRARWERAARRLSTLFPEGKTFDYRSANAAETVRRVAAVYLPKYEADRFASAFATADLAGKRTIYKAMLNQSFHAAGLPLSKSGREWMQRQLDDLESPQRYSVSADGDNLPTSEGEVRRTAVWPGQLDNYAVIPDFVKLHRLAAKTSMWDRFSSGTSWVPPEAVAKGADWLRQGLSRLLYSEQTDKLMSLTKIGMISRPASGLRNALDELGGVALRGELGTVLRARRAVSAARRVRLNDDAAERLTRTVGSPDRPVTTLADATEGYLSGRAARVVPGGPDAFGLTRQELDDAASELQDVALDGIADDILMSGSYIHDTWAAKVDKNARDGVKRGYPGQEFQVSWNEVPVTDERGLTAWSHNLDQGFGPSSLGLGHAGLPHIVNGDRAAAEDAIYDVLKSDGLKDFRDRAEKVHFSLDGKRVTTDDMADEALRNHAKTLATEIELMVRGVDNKINPDLVKLINDGNLTVDALRKIPAKSRPQHAISKDVVPVMLRPTGSIAKLADMAVDNPLTRLYTAGMAKAYDLFVTRQVNWLVRHPLFTAFYAMAKKNMARYKQQLVDGGIVPDRAEEIVRKYAEQSAAWQVAQRVDNPHVRSQFSMVVRNMWMFERATEDFLRRWGRLIKEDPTRIRKALLALEGAQNSGIIDRDENGDMIFTYPGSGAVLTMMVELGNKLGITDFAKVPQFSDLTSKVTFLNPSLDNPIGFSASPIIAMPVKWLRALLPEWVPETAMATAQLDLLANGELGAGQPWWKSFIPSWMATGFEALAGNEKDEMVASTINASLKSLAAAGQLPPENATAEQIDDFLMNVKSASQNALLARVGLGMFLPAAPGRATDFEGAGPADEVFQALGVQDLDQEFKKLINDTSYESALAIWNQLHPDRMVYTIGTTETANGGPSIGYTEQIGNWLAGHSGFVKKYGSVAGYFLPQGNGEFSQQAWNTQLALGLRKYKSPKDLYQQLRISDAQNLYYPLKDQYDAAIAKAQAKGDKDTVAQLKQAWTQQSDAIKVANPLFAAYQADYGERDQQRDQQFATLKTMLSDPDVPNGALMPYVADMVAAKDSMDEWIHANKGREDAETKNQRKAVKEDYTAYMEGIIAQHPELTPLYNGIFRIDEN